MCCHPQIHLEDPAAELAAAEADLLMSLRSTSDDEDANQRISCALERLRSARDHYPATGAVAVS